MDMDSGDSVKGGFRCPWASESRKRGELGGLVWDDLREGDGSRVWRWRSSAKIGCSGIRAVGVVCVEVDSKISSVTGRLGAGFGDEVCSGADLASAGISRREVCPPKCMLCASRDWGDCSVSIQWIEPPGS
jgi:hypothetical protein